MLTSILALLGPKIIGLMAIVLAAIGLAFQQRLAGAKAERNKQAQSDLTARTEGQKIDDAVAGRSPDDNRERLSKWSPKP